MKKHRQVPQKPISTHLRNEKFKQRCLRNFNNTFFRILKNEIKKVREGGLYHPPINPSLINKGLPSQPRIKAALAYRHLCFNLEHGTQESSKIIKIISWRIFSPLNKLNSKPKPVIYLWQIHKIMLSF